MLNKIKLLFLCILITACSKEVRKNALFQLVDVKTTNVTFQNNLIPTNNLNILDYLYYYNGAGVAVGDIDNDGLPDVFFTANQGKNKLYLNKGNFIFEDISEKANVSGNSDWNTGTVMADVNGDGFLDIYVCAVAGINGLQGANELYINNGNSTFTESAQEYGLNFQNYATTAAFFDFDNDGDLDMYLLNHAVHTQNSFGKVEIRYKRNENSGDKLLRNDGGIFIDVSEKANIFGGANGYGLGIATQDFNNDGYIDMYISNDFHEDDYYYINNGDGTFTEQIKDYFGKTSRFSMGSDVADINHDGLADILTLDMTPENETVLKASMGDESIDMLNMRTKQLGYHYQYARNMLHINNGNNFSETALFSGIAATDWSWSALFADFNQDGEQDIFISNGIPKRPNDLDYIKYVSNEHIRKQLNNSKLVDHEALQMMPSGAVANYIFEGQKNISFKNQSGNWIPKDSIISNGSAYADFDNDGDMDLVTNNTNSPATFYKNNTNSKANYLKLKFQYAKGNNFGIGTKATSYHNGIKQYKQLFTSKGFQSSSEAVIHFGYGTAEIIDSIVTIWPDNTSQTLKNIKTNQTLILKPLENRFPVKYETLHRKTKPWLTKIDSIKGLHFTHIENNFIDVNKYLLIPYQISDRGPATAVGDLNNDGKDDIFFGSSRNQPSQLFIQTEEGFVKKNDSIFEVHKITEDISAHISDFNNDGKNDLFIASGGGEFNGNSQYLMDKLYLNNTNLNFTKSVLPAYFENASIIRPFDANNDGDLDIFVGNHTGNLHFGELPNSYMLINNRESFNLQPIENLGMVTDAIVTDFNKDGQLDLIVVGEWMQPVFLQNSKGDFKDVTSNSIKESLSGLWQSIVAFDIDNDGDEDYVLGNFGLNSKFKASSKYPMKMYVSDFDKNKSVETIIAIEKNHQYFTLHGLDELASQLTYLKKKYNVYKDFAGKTIEEIFGENLKDAEVFTVSELSSGYLENDNGSFTFRPFQDVSLQIAPIRSMLKFDFNSDGHDELLLAGNYFGLTPYHGKFDSFSGAILKDTGDIISANKIGVNFFNKAVKHLNIFKFQDQNYLLVTINNDEIQLYQIPK